MQTARLAMAENDFHFSLDLVRERVRARLADVGMSANEASRRAGLGLSYVNDLLGGKNKKPLPSRLGQLAEVLNCDVEYLTGEQSVPRARLAVVGGVNSSSTQGVSIPLYTVEMTDSDGFFRVDEKSQVDFPVAFNLAVPQTYAIVVPDDSNAPRYFAGEYVIAHPNRPVSRGGFAVLRMRDGRSAIRRIDSILTDKVLVSSLEAQSPVEVARDEIDAIHRIIGAAEQA